MVTATNRRARASNHPDASSASLVVRTLLPVALSIVILVGCGPAANQSSASPATETGSAVKSPQRAAQASAMIGGLGHGGYNPDFVWCQLRGTEAGMVFHGTLSGPNIGTNKFDVSTRAAIQRADTDFSDRRNFRPQVLRSGSKWTIHLHADVG